MFYHRDPSGTVFTLWDFNLLPISLCLLRGSRQQQTSEMILMDAHPCRSVLMFTSEEKMTSMG